MSYGSTNDLTTTSTAEGNHHSLPPWANFHDMNGTRHSRYDMQRHHSIGGLQGGMLDPTTSIPIDVKPTIQAAQLAGYSGENGKKIL